MDCHNFGFGTGYKIFDKNGALIESKFDPSRPEVEGMIEIEVKDRTGRIEHKHQQPMRSFIKSFLQVLYDGRRLGYHSTGICVTKQEASQKCHIALGQTASEVVVDTDQPLDITTTQYFADAHPLVFEGLTRSTDAISIQVSFTTSRNASSSRSVSYNTASLSCVHGPASSFYSTWICNDKFPLITVDAYRTIKITAVLSFPVTAYKTLTEEFVYNFVQNLISPHTFTTITDDSVLGTLYSDTVSDQSSAFKFAKAFICIGSSDQQISTSDHKLGSMYAATGDGFSSLGMSRPGSNKSYIVAGNSAYMDFYRDFKNISDSPLTVREAGFVTDGTLSSGFESAGSFLIARWLTGNIVVQPDQTLRVYFQPTVTA